MSTNLQEAAPAIITSATAQQRLNAEEVTTIATDFLKRIGNKAGLRPKRVSLEDEIYTVEVETKKMLAVVKISFQTREIREYDVQPKNEENSSSFNFKSILVSLVISVGVAATIHFCFKMLGI